jgi:hypothetical protein
MQYLILMIIEETGKLAQYYLYWSLVKDYETSSQKRSMNFETIGLSLSEQRLFHFDFRLF